MIDFFLDDNILTIEQDVTLVGFSESFSGSTKFIPNRWFEFLSVNYFLQTSQKCFEKISDYDILQDSFRQKYFDKLFLNLSQS